MPKLTPRLVRAWLDSLSSGVAEFDRDSAPGAPPALELGAGAPAVTDLKPAAGVVIGRASGYLAEPNGDISFVLPLEHGCEVDAARDRVYVGGDFNGWQQAVGREEWRRCTQTAVPGQYRSGRWRARPRLGMRRLAAGLSCWSWPGGSS